jgi:hypothetical protein
MTEAVCSFFIGGTKLSLEQPCKGTVYTSTITNGKEQ